MPLPRSKVLDLVLVLAIVASALLVGEIRSDGVLVSAAANWKYAPGSTVVSDDWREPGFDDLSWNGGPAPLGYGLDGLATSIQNGGDPVVYLRHEFEIEDPGGIVALRIRLQRDDGAIVFLNGDEVLRSNVSSLPDEPPRAYTAIQRGEERRFVDVFVKTTPLRSGSNVIAAEVYRASSRDSDLLFAIELTGMDAGDPLVVHRGPYLQRMSPTSVVVRWRTSSPSDSAVFFGTGAGHLDRVVRRGMRTTEHSIELSGLTPNSRYYYGVGTSAGVLVGDEGNQFRTSPRAPRPGRTRIWVVGDSGTANGVARAVLDSYLRFATGRTPDVWLMLGDNAYPDGSDSNYEEALFDVYESLLPRTALWPVVGNHDWRSVHGGAEQGPFFSSFTLPEEAEAGGIPSHHEGYYSFDHGSVHFVALNSMLDGPGFDEMLRWLAADLSATKKPWKLAYWHHPPFSRGSHDSDDEPHSKQMRERVLPIIERAGVDLVVTGHSHSYERSFLLHGHYGRSNELVRSQVLDRGDGGWDGPYRKAVGPGAPGTVYIVAGNAGKLRAAPLDHPTMAVSRSVAGSLVIDARGNRLGARLLDSLGVVNDFFVIEKREKEESVLGRLP